MRFSPLRFVILFIWLSAPSYLTAQASNEDTIYLKNGSVIKGHLLEMPGETVRIQTTDGQVLVFRMQVVEQVLVANPQQVPKVGEGAKSREGDISILAGLSFPSGDLAATDGQNAGFARMGFAIALQYLTINRSSFLFGVGIAYSSNPLDEQKLKEALQSGEAINSTSWTSLLPYLVLGFGQPSGPLRPFIAGVAGLAFSSSPQVVLGNAAQPSASTNSICYGAMGGFLISSRFQIVIRYLASSPKYEIGPPGMEAKFEQSSNLFQLLVGFNF